ncbi:Pancreatic lipase-related protein 2 [Myotis brandtii]|uniref:Pancreatic lipase-related protein 2 n=1 Tax=Myotis brandtii TaxID=109478 RepID=S7MWZ7_MYOBR|nr:Pancreatic lipase-related protein 2 [Myotis brandtii]
MGYSLENVHLIGHSLGAHTAGEAGRRLGGSVGRITGLDPAEPGFQDTPEEVRLDPSDAMFVDVIHTDTSPTVPYLGTLDFVACNHLRSYKYYSSSSINPDGFLGYPCASYEEFQEIGPWRIGNTSLLELVPPQHVHSPKQALLSTRAHGGQRNATRAKPHD